MDPLAISSEETAGGSVYNGRSSVTFFRSESAPSTADSKDDPIYNAIFKKISCQLAEFIEARPVWFHSSELIKHSIPYLVGSALEDIGEVWEEILGPLLPDIFDVLLFTVEADGQSRKYKLNLLEQIPRLLKILLAGKTPDISKICWTLFAYFFSGMKEAVDEIFTEAWDGILVVLQEAPRLPGRYIDLLFTVAKQLSAEKCDKHRRVAVKLMLRLLYLGPRQRVVQELVPLYVELGCNDPNFYVRKEVATSFPQFCANLTPQENSDHMVILYLILMHDQYVLNRKIGMDAAPTLLFMLRLLKDYAESHQQPGLSWDVRTQMVKCMAWITTALREVEMNMNISAYRTLGPVIAILQAKRMPGLKCERGGKITFDQHNLDERDYFHKLDADEKRHHEDDLCETNEFSYWNVTPSLSAEHLNALQKRPPDYSNRLLPVGDTNRKIPLRCYNDRITNNTCYLQCRIILVKCFIRYVDHNKHKDVAVICAQNLPCIVYTCRQSAWPMLYPLMKHCAYHDYHKVRQVIAASIHEMVPILGHDVTMKDLCPIYTDFLTDMDDVKMCAMIKIHKLLTDPRPDLVSFVLEWLAKLADLISKTEGAWRNRALVATQIGDCMRHFNPKDAMELTSSILMKMLGDEVCRVRNETALAVGQLIVLAADHDFVFPFLDNLIDKFANSNYWRDRQTCMKAIGEAMQWIDPFDQSRKLKLSTHFLDVLSLAAYDPVPNVRIHCAHALALYPNCPDRDMQVYLGNLKLDSDWDVCAAAYTKPENLKTIVDTSTGPRLVSIAKSELLSLKYFC